MRSSRQSTTPHLLTLHQMHVDQLTVIIRYVLSDGPIERSVKFIPMFSHTGAETAKIILNFLDENGINIEDCRGQSCDNAANMCGEYNGVQAHIREKCSTNYYMPCTAHSLNLVGKSTAECCSAAASFFDLPQSLYAWLVASTHPSLAGTSEKPERFTS